MRMTEPVDDRLTELEVRLSFIDDTVNGLSSADTEIARRLDRLERAVRDLRSDLINMRAGIGSDPANEPPPPHY
jgi:SlyX protein